MFEFKVEKHSFGELSCEGEERGERRRRVCILKVETLILPKEGRPEHE